MTHVSRKKLSENTREIFYDALVDTFKDNPKRDVNIILSSLLTKTEIEMLYKRLMIMFLKKEGYGTDEIAQAVNTTRQTVSRISTHLLLMNTKDRKILLSKLRGWKTKNILKSGIKTLANVDISQSAVRKKLRPY